MALDLTRLPREMATRRSASASRYATVEDLLRWLIQHSSQAPNSAPAMVAIVSVSVPRALAATTRDPCAVFGAIQARATAATVRENSATPLVTGFESEPVGTSLCRAPTVSSCFVRFDYGLSRLARTKLGDKVVLPVLSQLACRSPAPRDLSKYGSDRPVTLDQRDSSCRVHRQCSSHWSRLWNAAGPEAVGEGSLA